MKYIMPEKNDPHEDPYKPKISWQYWLPVLGFFLPEYPCNRMDMDVWHSFWVIIVLSIIMN